MAGNSRRKGAMRKPGTKKGATTGSGGQKPKALKGRGPTPKAERRTGHPAARRAAAQKQAERGRVREPGAAELVAGRNPVVECLRAGVPATALYVALGVDTDDRITEAVQRAADRGVSVLEVSRAELDRLTGGAVHQGLGLSVPPFEYVHPNELLDTADGSGEPPCWWRWTGSPIRAISAR